MFEFIYWLLSYVLPFLAVLTVIVFVHEMGHYLVARWNGVAIQTFSIGFGKELVGWDDKHGTRWRISAIPLGGYVRFVGDMNAASTPDEEVIANASPDLAPQLFANKNVWRRIAVVVAGPLANVILTFVILYALLLGYGRYVTPPAVGEVIAGSVAEEAGIEPGDIFVSVDGFAVRGFEDFDRLIATSPERAVTIQLDRGSESQTVVLVPDAVEYKDRFGNTQRIGNAGVYPFVLPATVGEVLKDTVAEKAGLQAGDRFISVDGVTVSNFSDFQKLVVAKPGQPITIALERAGQRQTVTLEPEAVEVEDRVGSVRTIGRIGISPGEPEAVAVTLYRPGPIEAVGMTFEEIRFLVQRTAAFLGDFFVGRGDVEQLGGPIKVAKVSGEVATLGIVALINLTALLSLNIGIFNLLPVPMLDGGHLMYYLVEAVRGRPLSMRVQEIGFRFGFALVLALMVFTLFNDTLFAYLRTLS
ncbi:RIP metalloprotease RseP [Devosia sp. SL43]|uniref:RIP metalloprotease RseP n=1 Tax=Devosia sp. SL43 TaxID=2806348 RepID=UPI001F006E38|nr:RIP metalloprotease RseP [Devosia sp. SL43]UJW86303.1 RIP metalloprotease RseP [Devosia sp. SL43]